jgi:hypothetical protein
MIFLLLVTPSIGVYISPQVGVTDVLVGDEPEAWSRAGFTVRGCSEHEASSLPCKGEVCVGGTRFVLAGSGYGRGTLGFTLERHYNIARNNSDTMTHTHPRRPSVCQPACAANPTVSACYECAASEWSPA